eukprot:TRINITY_DN8616_c0_g1_i14.p1 TRINITY_DN8616_c0_g1~~TRINITY_DN8616_c0_g1_i14.p1  ORF type:complete len:283 (-),score=89.65 TRINITY_DN8616_c0_g1_i14:31-879(-)
MGVLQTQLVEKNRLVHQTQTALESSLAEINQLKNNLLVLETKNHQQQQLHLKEVRAVSLRLNQSQMALEQANQQLRRLNDLVTQYQEQGEMDTGRANKQTTVINPTSPPSSPPVVTPNSTQMIPTSTPMTTNSGTKRNSNKEPNKTEKEEKEGTKDDDGEVVAEVAGFLLQHKLKQFVEAHEGEVMALRVTIRDLENTRKVLENEVVTLQSREEEMGTRLRSLSNLEEEHVTLTARLWTALELIGEREERIETLESDMKEMRALYKQHVNALSSKIQQLESK